MPGVIRVRCQQCPIIGMPAIWAMGLPGKREAPRRAGIMAMAFTKRLHESGGDIRARCSAPEKDRVSAIGDKTVAFGQRLLKTTAIRRHDMLASGHSLLGAGYNHIGHQIFECRMVELASQP